MDFAVYLGSGRTVVYKKNEGIVLSEATCIAYERVGKKKKEELRVIAVGDTAKRMQDRTDEQIIVASPVVGCRIVDVELCKMYFQEIIKKIGGVWNKTALFCIQCSLTSVELDGYKSVAYSAGFTGVEFVPSVVASAIGNGFDIKGATACLSVNIGEGGSDIAAIAFGGIIAGGSITDGGASATEAVRAFIESKHKIGISERIAKIAKDECQTLLLNNEVSYKLKGIDIETGATHEVWFNGVDCYKVILPVYGRIVKAVLQVIAECSPEVAGDIKAGAVFVGGEGSSPSGLREFLTTNLDINVVLDTRSANAVIMGAGMLLNDKELLRKVIRAN